MNVDLETVARLLERGESESLVALYAADARMELHGLGGVHELDGPVGLREGLQQIAAAGLTHQLALGAIQFDGAFVVDRCREPRSGTTVAWGGIAIRGGLISRHWHASGQLPDRALSLAHNPHDEPREVSQ